MNGNHRTISWALPEGAFARLGRGRVHDMAFSPDGVHLAVATTIGLWVYARRTMQPIALWETERGMVSAISFSHDGHQFVTRNADGIVKVCDTATQHCVAKIHGQPRGTQLIFSPDSRHIAASGIDEVSVWCTETGMPVAKFAVAAAASRAAPVPPCFSPDGTLLASASSADGISVMHLKAEERVSRLSTDNRRVNWLTFSPCGQFLAAGIQKSAKTGQNAEVRVWNVQHETLEMDYSAYEGFRVIPAYSPEGVLRVAEIDTDKVMMWDASRAEKVALFERQGPIEAIHFSPDGNHFAIATHREIHVWDRHYPTRVSSVKGHTLPADSVFFSQGGQTLVSRYWGESGIVFWDVARKRAKRTLSAPPGNRGKACALSPCEEMLAFNVGETGEAIDIVNVASGTQIARLTEHQRYVTALAFSPDGKTFASGDDKGNLYLWDVPRWERVHTLVGHTKSIWTVVFHPDGKRLVTASQDGTARVWDVESVEQLASLPLTLRLATSLYQGDKKQIPRLERWNPSPQWTRYIRSIAFSPDGGLIVGGLADEIRFWDATTYDIRMAILLPDGCHRPFALAFSPDGRYLASGSWWKGTEKVSIRLWAVASGENLATFWGHPTDVQDLAFSPDGALLASASFDGTILLWDVTPYLHNETS